MLTISLRNLWEHKLRSFLLGGAIVTGVAFVVASFVFTDSLKAGFTDLFSEAFESIDIQVSPKIDEDDPLVALSFDLPTFDDSVADTIRSVDGIEGITPEVQGFITMEEAEDHVPGFGPPSFGIGWFEGTSAFTISEGRPPEADDEVAVSANALEDRELVVGDTVRIAGTGPLEDFTIVGVLQLGSQGNSIPATFAAFTTDKAQQLLDMEGEVSAFGITTEAGADIDAIVEELNRVLPEEAEAISSQSAAEAQAAELQEGIGFFNTFLLVFAGISLVVGAFVVYNAFRVVVAQRTRELALLRVLGTTRAELLRMVLIEAVIVGLAASATGVVIGIGVAVGVRALLEAIGLGSLPDSGLVVTANAVIIGITVGTITAALSALLPAVRATHISPMSALRDQSEVRRARPWWKWAGLGVTGASVAAVMLAAFQARDVAGALSGNSDPVTIAGIGAFGLFLGFFLLARVLARPTLAVIGRPLKKLTGTLARENARRTPRRTATTAASLMIGLGLVATVAILSASVEDTILDAIDDSFAADAVIQGGLNPLAGMSEEIYPIVIEADGVDAAARINLAPAVFPNEQANFLVGIDPATVNLAIAFESVEGSWDDVVGDGLAVQRIEADLTGVGLGDDVEFTLTGGETVTFRVAAIFDLQGGVSDSQSYYINYDRIREINPDARDSSIMLRLDPDADSEVVLENLNDQLEDFGGVQATSIESLIAQISGPIQALTGMVAGLLFMSVLVAVVGIVLTLYLAVHERTREIGLLRAIGMTRQQISRMIRWESVLIALYGALLGLIIGIFLGWGLTVSIIGEGAALSVPWTWVVAGFFGSAIAGVLAAVVPASQATRLDVLEAIAYE